MAANESPSKMDYSCPVCRDIFQDPVMLLCGHSFCKHCLQEWWRASELQTCPVCKQFFPMAHPLRNLALRDVCEVLMQEKMQRARSTEICRLHGEKLKLFCQDDQQLICVICRDAQKHKTHNIVPIGEAAEACKTALNCNLTDLETKLEKFKAQKSKCDEIAIHIKPQAQQTEMTIKEEFQKLYEFLQAEEAARMDAVRKEAEFKSIFMDTRIAHLTAEISSLTDKIEAIKTEMKAEDISFMMNVKSTIDRSQCNLPDPEIPSATLINEAKHVGNLLFTVWKKMKDIIQYTPVTLDPNTSGSRLIISECMTRLARRATIHPLPHNPERLWSNEVLGSEGFSSGKHSWDVELRGGCSVGVAAITRGFEKVTWYVGPAPMLCEHDNLVSRDPLPRKISVQLDYDKGILSFFDLDKKTLARTIQYTFTETVFPYFVDNAKLLPAEF
ncbi:hypothetical protein VZT92_018986 [Zoarces viviparus]|uniref:Uncharacterized protein n=1 Tax=Zoarces viviparus TaxID=48416 RepID=A0AAW1EJ63_ZOAVI